MKNQKPEILYSEPVKEIMGKPPRRILRWGTTIMLLVFVLFIVFSWLIRYPDIILAQVEITTTNPPVTLVSKITGRINSFFVNSVNYSIRTFEYFTNFFSISFRYFSSPFGKFR